MQVSSAALRRDIGNNPDSGLDKCPDNQHIGAKYLLKKHPRILVVLNIINESLTQMHSPLLPYPAVSFTPSQHPVAAFFHNWDALHVDSWGCLSDQESHPVLCCRRA